jgi:DNA-directed RNA polymerase specialized sigma24 family protein
VWAVLVCLTARKALDLRAHDRRQKRGGSGAAGESVLDALFGTEDGGAGLGQVVGREPTPEFAAQAAETFRRLLAQLPTEELRAIALAKMEGFTNEEIAARRGCALATVERRLGLIRAVWQKELRP